MVLIPLICGVPAKAADLKGVAMPVLAYLEAEKRVRCGAATLNWRVKVERKARLKLREAILDALNHLERDQRFGQRKVTVQSFNSSRILQQENKYLPISNYSCRAGTSDCEIGQTLSLGLGLFMGCSSSYKGDEGEKG